MQRIIIAIDGHSACGKSTTARGVAMKLNYKYIDTGAMYRAVTLHFHNDYVTITNPKDVKSALEAINIDFHYNEKKDLNEIYLNGLNVEEEIRKMYISEKVSEISALSAVREVLRELQRKIGKRKGVVMDGRDIGTVVFPEAELKVFMTADFEVRAKRRQQELIEKGTLIDLQEVMDNLKKRDEMDSSREDSPLKKAGDAFVLDTTYLTIDEQIDKVVQLSIGKILEK